MQDGAGTNLAHSRTLLQLWEASIRVRIVLAYCGFRLVFVAVLFLIASNDHVDVRDVLFLRSQDVRLKIDLWHPVLFRKHSERCFIQNHVVAPTETVPASVKQKMVMSPCGICSFMEQRPSEHLFQEIFYPRGHYLQVSGEFFLNRKSCRELLESWVGDSVPFHRCFLF